MIKCRKFISLHQLPEDSSRSGEFRRESKFKKDILKAVLITPDDEWAVFLGGDKKLKVYGAKLSDGFENMRELTIDNPRQYTFNEEDHKACIMPNGGEMFLLISCKGGRNGGQSVRFALDTLLVNTRS